MSQERSSSSDSLADLNPLNQSYYSLNLDQNSDQINLNTLNLNESNQELNNRLDSEENDHLSLIEVRPSNQNVFFHPSFLQLNSSTQDINSIELTTFNNPMQSLNCSSSTSKDHPQLKDQSNSMITNSKLNNLIHNKTSFEWEMYNDRNRVLKELRKNRKFVDIQLIADDGYSEYVHSTVISALGSGLAKCIFVLKEDPKTPCTILDSDSLKNHIKQIRLKGISGPVLKVIVNCAYTGFIETEDKQVVWSILELAERFEMFDVLKACCTYLIYHLNIDNCIKLLHLGIKFKHKLRTSAWNFIRLKFDRIVNECADYIHLTIDELIKLLEDDHLNTITGEQIVWQGICRWILADLFNRTKYLNRLLDKIRFGRLPLEFIEDVIAKEPLLIEIDNGLFNLNNGENNQNDSNDKQQQQNEINEINKSSSINQPNEQIMNENAIQIKSNENSIDLKKNKKNLFNLINSKSKDVINFDFTKKSVYDNGQSLNFEESNSSKLMTLIKRMIAIRKNSQNQYKIDNRNLLVDLKPYFVRPRVPAEVIFVIGGWQENMITTLIETYDVRTDMWLESHISLEYTRAYHGLEILNGFLYIIGGTNGSKTLSSMHCFNPNNGKWYERANMYERRCYVNTSILNDLIYAMGGHNGAQRLNTVEKYDYKTNQWLQSSPMNLARSDASATTYDNKIYIAGGLNEHVQNTVEFYNPIDDTWTFIQPMQYQRNSLSLVLYAGYLFALGGTNGTSRLNKVERYDFNSKNWVLSKPMRCSRSTFSACVLEDKLYVVGGHDQHSQIKSVEYYDIQTDQWYEVKNLKRSRSGFNLCCYRSFTVSSKFTYNYYTEQQMTKNKKNIIKNKESDRIGVDALASRVNSKDLNSVVLPTIGMNRFRRRRAQNRFSSIYNINVRTSRIRNSIENQSNPSNQPNRPSNQINSSAINQFVQISLTSEINQQQQDTIININSSNDTTNQNQISNIDQSSNNYNNSISLISHTNDNIDLTQTQSTIRQEIDSSSQNHDLQSNITANRNESQTIYPSTSGLSIYPNSRIINDTSSSTSSEIHTPTNQTLVTRSLNNERLIDQEDETQNNHNFDHHNTI